MWRADVHDLVLGAVAAKTAAPADLLDLAGFGHLATVLADKAGEHLLLSDGLRCIRVDIRSGTIRDGPALLHYRIVGLDSAQGPSLTLRRLLALCSSGRFSAGLHPPEARARRFIMLLRAHDALAAGASQREIAEVLLSAEAQGRRWRVTAPSLRSRAQRLARGAGAMANGGYRRLLGQTGNVPG
jgi:hypothetical protein